MISVTLGKMVSLCYNISIMKNYIVFDLEWNQSANGKERSIPHFPFEIIEIGAVKLNEAFQMVDEFHRLIRPQVYTQMHHAISEVTHMDMKELRNSGELFPDAAADFLSWCGGDAVFCTWGNMDLLELQRNMDYYHMDNPFPKPLFYYDVQKLYGLFCRENARISLDSAVEEQSLLENRPFHRALDDAYYTGKLLTMLGHKPGPDTILPFLSVDYYRLPSDKKEEIRMTFPGYSKYVSRIFDTKEDAMEDKGVTEMMCYRCGRMLRKKVRWFTPNQKTYFALACCPEHGYLKGKIRMKKVEEESVFVVKTLKLTDEEGAQNIIQRKEDVRKKRAERNRMKRRQKQAQKKAVSTSRCTKKLP